MKTILKALTVGATLCGSATTHADARSFDCSVDGASALSSSDPIEHVVLDVVERSWSVVHLARSGASYQRSAQYRSLLSTGFPDPTWVGINFKRPNVIMVGRLAPRDGQTFIYSERSFDAKIGGQQVYEMDAVCWEHSVPIAPPTVSMQQAPINPAPQAPDRTPLASTAKAAPEPNLNKYSRREICLGTGEADLQAFEYATAQTTDVSLSKGKQVADVAIFNFARKIHEGDGDSAWHAICDNYSPDGRDD